MRTIVLSGIVAAAFAAGIYFVGGGAVLAIAVMFPLFAVALAIFFGRITFGFIAKGWMEKLESGAQELKAKFETNEAVGQH